ncbi:MAG: hypothetical protein ACXIVF_17795 [Rhizobiaceae bacterium]
MEIIWLVLLIMVPLSAGGFYILYRAQRAGRVRQPSDGLRADRSASPSRPLPRRLGTTGLVLAAAVIVAVGLALFVGFPLLRTLLIAFNAPVEAD